MNADSHDLERADAALIADVVQLAVNNVAAGGGPFGALIARDGIVVATGVNRVTRDLDPSAHAEVTAIRAACRELDTFSLAGCTLYTSCEPCPMCLAAALWARLDRIVFAADRDDAAAGGFDDRAFYDLFDGTSTDWPARVVNSRYDGAFAPFEAWLAADHRTGY